MEKAGVDAKGKQQPSDSLGAYQLPESESARTTIELSVKEDKQTVRKSFMIGPALEPLPVAEVEMIERPKSSSIESPIATRQQGAKSGSIADESSEESEGYTRISQRDVVYAKAKRGEAAEARAEIILDATPAEDPTKVSLFTSSASSMFVDTQTHLEMTHRYVEEEAFESAEDTPEVPPAERSSHIYLDTLATEYQDSAVFRKGSPLPPEEEDVGDKKRLPPSSIFIETEAQSYYGQTQFRRKGLQVQESAEDTVQASSTKAKRYEEAETIVTAEIDRPPSSSKVDVSVVDANRGLPAKWSGHELSDENYNATLELRKHHHAGGQVSVSLASGDSSQRQSLKVRQAEIDTATANVDLAKLLPEASMSVVVNEPRKGQPRTHHAVETSSEDATLFKQLSKSASQSAAVAILADKNTLKPQSIFVSEISEASEALMMQIHNQHANSSGASSITVKQKQRMQPLLLKTSASGDEVLNTELKLSKTGGKLINEQNTEKSIKAANSGLPLTLNLRESSESSATSTVYLQPQGDSTNRDRMEVESIFVQARSGAPQYLRTDASKVEEVWRELTVVNNRGQQSITSQGSFTSANTGLPVAATLQETSEEVASMAVNMVNERQSSTESTATTIKGNFTVFAYCFTASQSSLANASCIIHLQKPVDHQFLAHAEAIVTQSNQGSKQYLDTVAATDKHLDANFDILKSRTDALGVEATNTTAHEISHSVTISGSSNCTITCQLDVRNLTEENKACTTLLFCSNTGIPVEISCQESQLLTETVNASLKNDRKVFFEYDTNYSVFISRSGPSQQFTTLACCEVCAENEFSFFMPYNTEEISLVTSVANRNEGITLDGMAAGTETTESTFTMTGENNSKSLSTSVSLKTARVCHFDFCSITESEDQTADNSVHLSKLKTDTDSSVKTTVILSQRGMPQSFSTSAAQLEEILTDENIINRVLKDAGHADAVMSCPNYGINLTFTTQESKSNQINFDTAVNCFDKHKIDQVERIIQSAREGPKLLYYFKASFTESADCMITLTKNVYGMSMPNQEASYIMPCINMSQPVKLETKTFSTTETQQNATLDQLTRKTESSSILLIENTKIYVVFNVIETMDESMSCYVSFVQTLNQPLHDSTDTVLWVKATERPTNLTCWQSEEREVTLAKAVTSEKLDEAALPEFVFPEKMVLEKTLCTKAVGQEDIVMKLEFSQPFIEGKAMDYIIVTKNIGPRTIFKVLEATEIEKNLHITLNADKIARTHSIGLTIYDVRQGGTYVLRTSAATDAFLASSFNLTETACECMALPAVLSMPRVGDQLQLEVNAATESSTYFSGEIDNKRLNTDSHTLFIISESRRDSQCLKSSSTSEENINTFADLSQKQAISVIERVTVVPNKGAPSILETKASEEQQAAMETVLKYAVAKEEVTSTITTANTGLPGSFKTNETTEEISNFAVALTPVQLETAKSADKKFKETSKGGSFQLNTKASTEDYVSSEFKLTKKENGDITEKTEVSANKGMPLSFSTSASAETDTCTETVLHKSSDTNQTSKTHIQANTGMPVSFTSYESTEEEKNMHATFVVPDEKSVGITSKDILTPRDGGSTVLNTNAASETEISCTSHKSLHEESESTNLKKIAANQGFPASLSVHAAEEEVVTIQDSITESQKTKSETTSSIFTAKNHGMPLQFKTLESSEEEKNIYASFIPFDANKQGEKTESTFFLPQNGGSVELDTMASQEEEVTEDKEIQQNQASYATEKTETAASMGVPLGLSVKAATEEDAALAVLIDKDTQSGNTTKLVTDVNHGMPSTFSTKETTEEEKNVQAVLQKSLKVTDEPTQATFYVAHDGGAFKLSTGAAEDSAIETTFTFTRSEAEERTAASQPAINLAAPTQISTEASSEETITLNTSVDKEVITYHTTTSLTSANTDKPISLQVTESSETETNLQVELTPINVSQQESANAIVSKGEHGGVHEVSVNASSETVAMTNIELVSKTVHMSTAKELRSARHGGQLEMKASAATDESVSINQEMHRQDKEKLPNGEESSEIVLSEDRKESQSCRTIESGDEAFSSTYGFNRADDTASIGRTMGETVRGQAVSLETAAAGETAAEEVRVNLNCRLARVDAEASLREVEVGQTVSLSTEASTVEETEALAVIEAEQGQTASVQVTVAESQVGEEKEYSAAAVDADSSFREKNLMDDSGVEFEEAASSVKVEVIEKKKSVVLISSF